MDGWCRVKKGLIYGKTDDFSYNVVENPVHVHDFQATLLHLMGLNHEKLTFNTRKVLQADRCPW